MSKLWNSIPPPHLSPFVDNNEEGHVPEYAEAIERLKAAARNEVLPLPGTGKEDLDDPDKFVSITDRAEDIAAAERKQKVRYFDDPNLIISRMNFGPVYFWHQLL